MAVGPFDAGRLRRRPAFDNLVTRIREDEAAVRDAAPPPEVAPEPFSNTVALLRERDLGADFPAAPVAGVDETPLVDIDLENGFVLTPQGFVQKPGAKPDPVAVFDRNTGRLTPLSGFQRVLPGNSVELLAALQHDVDRILRRDVGAEAEVLVPFGPDQFREAAREPAAEPFDLLGIRRREIEARPPVTFEEAAAQIEPIPERPERPPLELTANQAAALQIPDISKVSEFQRETVAGEWFRNADAVINKVFLDFEAKTVFDNPRRSPEFRALKERDPVGAQEFLDAREWARKVETELRRADVSLFDVIDLPFKIVGSALRGAFLSVFRGVQPGPSGTPFQQSFEVYDDLPLLEQLLWESPLLIPGAVEGLFRVGRGAARRFAFSRSPGAAALAEAGLADSPLARGLREASLLLQDQQIGRAQHGLWRTVNEAVAAGGAEARFATPIRDAIVRSLGGAPVPPAGAAAARAAPAAAAAAGPIVTPPPARPPGVAAFTPTGTAVPGQTAELVDIIRGAVAQAPAGPVGGVPQRRELPPQLTDAGIVRASLDPATGEVLPPPPGSDLVRAVGEAFYVPEELGLAEATRIIQAGGVAPTAPLGAQTLFHGSRTSFTGIPRGDIAFLTGSKFSAEQFGPNIREFAIEPTARILKYGDLPASIRNTVTAPQSKAIAFARQGGFDGVELLRNNILDTAVWNKNVLQQVAPTAPPLPQSVSAPPPPDEVGLIETRPQAIPAPETLVAEDAAVAQVDASIPPVPPEPPRSFLTFGDAQFDRYKGITPNPIPGTRPFSERIRGFGKELEKAFTDEFARLNALGWQSEVDAALTRAASGRSQEIYRQAFNQIRNALGKDGSLVEFVDDYLVLRHQLEVMRATGRKTFRVTKGGKTQTFTPKQIQGLFVSMKNQLGPERYARVKQAASVVPSVYHDILRGTQELTAEQIEGLIKKFPWYNPILFEDEFSTGATILNPNRKLQSRQIKRLTEFSSDKQLTTPLTALANTINRRVAANARNDARGSIAQDAVANPKAAGGDVEIVEAKPPGASFDFFENGIRKWARLGPGSEWIAKDIELLTSQPKNIINRFARAINSIPRQFFTTYNPGFVATNTLFDGLTAFFAEGIGPRGFTKALLKNVKDMFIENETVNRFRLAGGDVGGFFRAREAAAVEEFITRSKTGVITLKNPRDLKRFANPFILIRELGHAGENAARVAAYEKGIKDGLPDREAGLRGRRVTVDFSRAGTASRVINDWFLFFNAGLQGFMLPGRRIASDPRSLARLAVLLSGYLGLQLYNTSYDEYQDVSLSDRKGWLIIMVPSDEYDNRGRKVPHYIRVLPLREFALVTGPIELIVGGLRTDAPEAYRTLVQEFEAWYPVWSPLSMITQTGGVELPTQALQTIQQIINNHDTFRDRDIVDEDMKLLPAAQQYDQFTDSLAIKIGQAINVSPKQLDFFVSNMFGSLGRDALRALNVVIGQIDRDLVDERIAALVDDLRSIATQVPPSQIEVARETFLEGLSVEDRDLVLSMERIPTEKIPFVDSFFRRFFKEHGGQVERTVREKIQETRPFSDLPPEALAQLQKEAVENAENLLASRISKEQYDSQRTRYRAVFSGGSTAEWRQAQLEGAVSRAELDEALPEAYRRSEEFQAVSAYQQIRAELISQAGGAFDADTWTFIETATIQELRQFYSETAVTYALLHKDDWIDRLPEPARSLERRRALQLDNGTWWDGYRDPGLSGLPSGQGAAGTAEPSGGRLQRGEAGGPSGGRRLDNTRSLLEGRLGR